MFKYGFLSLFYISFLFANSDLAILEDKVNSDLNSMISKIISEEDYFLTVNLIFDTNRVKEMVEGENISQNQGSTISPPPLPGFELNKEQSGGSAQNRQVYRFVEKKTFKSMSVQLSLNKLLDPNIQNQIKSVVTKYLKVNFPSTHRISFESIEMRKKETPMDNWVPWIIGTILLLGLLGLVIYFASKSRPQKLYPEVQSYKRPNDPEDAEFKEQKKKEQTKIPHYEHSSSEGERKIPALPASEKYIDMRSELLKLFSTYSDVFRIYYKSLDPESKNDITAALRGPAFTSLLRTLNVELSVSDQYLPPPSEERLLFHSKDFQEFIGMQIWQKKQFFGFLHQLTHGQLNSLFNDQNPLVSALMLKFLPSKSAAKILDHLDSEKRFEILAETARVDKIPSSELSKIEEMVRECVERLPKLMLENNKEDATVWSEILSQIEKQEELLMDLERIRPELYPILAKFRFKMEELPSLPTPLIHKVLDNVDNEELAKAFAGCSKDVVEFALNQVNEKRRHLIEGQIASFQGLPPSEIDVAKKQLVLKFREVMA